MVAARWTLSPAQTILLLASPSNNPEGSIPQTDYIPDLVNVFTASRQIQSTLATAARVTESFDMIFKALTVVAQQQIVRGQDHGVVGNSRLVCSARILLSEYGSNKRTKDTYKSDLNAEWVKDVLQMAKHAASEDEVTYYQCGRCSTLI